MPVIQAFQTSPIAALHLVPYLDRDVGKQTTVKTVPGSPTGSHSFTCLAIIRVKSQGETLLICNPGYSTQTLTHLPLAFIWKPQCTGVIMAKQVPYVHTGSTQPKRELTQPDRCTNINTSHAHKHMTTHTHTHTIVGMDEHTDTPHLKGVMAC